MSMAHMMDERGSDVWRPSSGDRDQDPLPEPTQSQSMELPGYLTPPFSDLSVSVSPGQWEWQSGHQSLSLSSTGSYEVVWRWSGDGADSRNEESSCSSWRSSTSNSLEGCGCPPLSGRVPVEPAETSNGLTDQGAMEACPVNTSSTDKPAQRRKRKGIASFLNRLWKAMKRPFRCCCHCSAVDVVEPLVLPPDLEPEPDPEPPSPAPDHSGIKPDDESFESLYSVGAMIGSGGFGRVYEGTRKFDGKKVAIKQMLKIDNDCYLNIPGHPKPLITEVALLLLMRREPRSPFIIQLYEWFEHPAQFTLIMEYPEPCESLHDFMARNPGLCEAAARFIMQQALLAVQHCIEHGVFHNDIHAKNFLLNKDTFHLKLIDFGCGQLFSSDGYESDLYIGAPQYWPPEALTEPRFHAVPTNVWALGVLLYKMVNACPPFRNRTEIARARVTFQNSKLSKECRDLIRQCLARDPTRRPTLEQMLRDEWIMKDLPWRSSGDSLNQ